jgi:hypothetical protein
MNIVPSKRPQGGTTVAKPRQRFFTRVSQALTLERMGYLYISAAILQSFWIYVLASRWKTVQVFAAIPFIGWTMVAIWALMAICFVLLAYIGVRIVYVARHTEFRVTQNPWEKRRSDNIAVILVLGIVMDFLCGVVLFLATNPDPGFAVFFSAFAGVRILKGNMEAVFQYYGM